jgi:nucleoside-diphosphate-sugar epimerase
MPENYKLIYRDYLHVDDFLRFIDNLTYSSSIIYNVSYGKSYSLSQVLEFLNNHSVFPKLKFIEPSKNLTSYISNDKIRNETKIEPTIDLDTGILMQINYLKCLIK